MVASFVFLTSFTATITCTFFSSLGAATLGPDTVQCFTKHFDADGVSTYCIWYRGRQEQGELSNGGFWPMV